MHAARVSGPFGDDHVGAGRQGVERKLSRLAGRRRGDDAQRCVDRGRAAPPPNAKIAAAGPSSRPSNAMRAKGRITMRIPPTAPRTPRRMLRSRVEPRTPLRLVTNQPTRAPITGINSRARGVGSRGTGRRARRNTPVAENSFRRCPLVNPSRSGNDAGQLIAGHLTAKPRFASRRGTVPSKGNPQSQRWASLRLIVPHLGHFLCSSIRSSKPRHANQTPNPTEMGILGCQQCYWDYRCSPCPALRGDTVRSCGSAIHEAGLLPILVRPAEKLWDRRHTGRNASHGISLNHEPSRPDDTGRRPSRRCPAG